MPGSLIPMYREMHKRKIFWGGSLLKQLDKIGALVKASGAQTLLDYGCGKGHQYSEKQAHLEWGGIMPTLYDPGVPELSHRPVGSFDGVICTDVLEHIPVDELDDVISDLVGYAKVWCFASIYCAPSKKTLSDGQNAHVTIRPPEWWRKRLEGAFQDRAALHLVFRGI